MVLVQRETCRLIHSEAFNFLHALETSLEHTDFFGPVAPHFKLQLVRLVL